MLGTLATGVLAAIASFRISLPDSSRLWLLLPLPTLALWVSTIGYGCLTDWLSMAPGGPDLGEALRCFATLLMTSVPLSIAMLVMLRYAALLRVVEVSSVGGLTILIWNLGVAALIASLASLFGRPMFTWMAARLMPNPVRPATGR
jgi:hypothetical protein